MRNSYKKGMIHIILYEEWLEDSGLLRLRLEGSALYVIDEGMFTGEVELEIGEFTELYRDMFEEEVFTQVIDYIKRGEDNK